MSSIPDSDKKSMARSTDPLVWIDLELTGLSPEDVILEISCVLTTAHLTPLVPLSSSTDTLSPSPSTSPSTSTPPPPPPFHAIIHCPESRLARMDAWCTRTHGQSGLSAACAASTTTLAQAAGDLRAYLQKHLIEGAGISPRRALLAGNSVHGDKAAMRRCPELQPVLDMLHYRIFDVSALKEAARRWCDEDVLRGVPEKGLSHRAVDDIYESIEEARYYMEVIFKPARVGASGEA